MDSSTALIAQLVVQCLQGFECFVAAAKFPDASQPFLFRLDIEQYKIKIWSKVWGISIKNLEARIQLNHLDQDPEAGLTDEDPPVFLFYAENIRKLTELLTKAKDLKSIYGLNVDDIYSRTFDQDVVNVKGSKPRLLRRKSLEALKRMTSSI